MGEERCLVFVNTISCVCRGYQVLYVVMSPTAEVVIWGVAGLTAVVALFLIGFAIFTAILSRSATTRLTVLEGQVAELDDRTLRALRRLSPGRPKKGEEEKTEELTRAQKFAATETVEGKPVNGASRKERLRAIRENMSGTR